VKLRFTPRATRDLAEIAEYLRTHNPAAALVVRDAILRALHNLTLFPAIGRPQNVEGVRKLGTPKSNSGRPNTAILSITSSTTEQRRS